MNPNQPQPTNQPIQPNQPAMPQGQVMGPQQSAPPPQNANSTQNSLQIAEIRDGIMIMNDGSYRSVIMTRSINFDLMSQPEREGVENAYQRFLNSLYFPIHIFIRSQKVDLRPYVEKLDKIRAEHDNMLLAYLMENYIGYIDQLVSQTNIMDKRFYIVVPFDPSPNAAELFKESKNFFTGLGGLFRPKDKKVTINEPDLQKAKDELRNRVQAVLSGLTQCGIQGLPLDTKELGALFYESYNPDTALRQHVNDINALMTPVVTKGTGEAPQPHLESELN